MDKDFLMKLKEVLEQLNNRVSNVEHTVNEVIVKSLVEAGEEHDYEVALGGFRESYPEVGELEPKLKSLYGDEYDVYKDLYGVASGHMNDEGFDMAKYVAEQIAQVKSKLDALFATHVAATEVSPEIEVVEQPITEISEEQLAAELEMAKANGGVI